MMNHYVELKNSADLLRIDRENEQDLRTSVTAYIDTRNKSEIHCQQKQFQRVIECAYSRKKL